MATLTGQTIAASYEQILHVDRDGGGNTSTLVNIKDGDNGTTFCASMTDASTAKAILSIDGSHANGTALYIDNSAGDGDVSLEWQLSGTTTWLMGIEDGDSDSLKICHDSTMGTDERLSFLTASTVFNEDSGDIDFRVEGNGDANLLFCDAGSDRVGIGTAAPLHALHVVGTNPHVYIGDSGAEDCGIVWRGNAVNMYMSLDDTTDDLTIGQGSQGDVGSNVRMVIENTGNVGIGTMSPATSLHIQSSDASNTNAVVRVQSLSASGTGDNARIELYDSSGASRSYWQIASDTATESIFSISDDSGNSKVQLIASGVSYFTGGNVGIGTASPHSEGHIEGDLTVGSVTGNRAAQVKSVYFSFSNAGSADIEVSGTFSGLLMVTTQMHTAGHYATAGYSVTSVNTVAAVSSQIWYNNSSWTSAIANGTNMVTITIDSPGGSGTGNVVFIGSDNNNSIAFTVS